MVRGNDTGKHATVMDVMAGKHNCSRYSVYTIAAAYKVVIVIPVTEQETGCLTLVISEGSAMGEIIVQVIVQDMKISSRVR